MKKVFFQRNGVRKVGASLCVLLAFFFMFGLETLAADDGFVSSKVVNQDVYIFVRGTEGVTDAKVQIGNSSCDSVGVQPVCQSGMPIRTILMFDSTISMKNAYGSNAIDVFSQMIDQHADNEEFKIVSFAEDAVELTEFSSDYEGLKGVLQSFQYATGDTYFSKSLYNLIKKNADPSFEGYYRIVIISDGVEDDVVSYTKEELNDLLVDSGITLHAIGINEKNSADTLKELFYLARSSGGKSIIADKNTDYQTIIDLFNEDYSIYCIKVSPEKDLCDGSKKDVKIELIGGAGNNQIIGTIRMPFGDGTKVETMSEKDLEEKPEKEEKEDKPSIPVIGPKQEEKEEKESGIKLWVIIVIITGGVILLGGGATAFILIKKKNDRKKLEEKRRLEEEQKQKELSEKARKTQIGASQKEDTQGGIAQNPIKHSGGTVMLWGGAKNYLVLKSRTSMCGDFKVEMKDSVTIGRVNGDIVIGDDMSISSTHCQISKKGELYYLKDLQSTNGTYCNGSRIKDEVPIMSGTIMKIGKCEFVISFVKE